jgi:hypothetical protein
VKSQAGCESTVVVSSDSPDAPFVMDSWADIKTALASSASAVFFALVLG